MNDREHNRSIDGIPIETDMDRMVERAIASLVERGKMTLDEAAAKRAELGLTVDEARERAERQRASETVQMDGEGEGSQRNRR